METAALIVMLALAQYLWFTLRVAVNRNRYEVNAPACTGNETWERLFRVQQNTMEQLLVFIPGTLAFAWLVSARWVWLPAALFIIGRFIYSATYIADPANRAVGMGMTLLANVILVAGVLVAVLVEMV